MYNVWLFLTKIVGSIKTWGVRSTRVGVKPQPSTNRALNLVQIICLSCRPRNNPPAIQSGALIIDISPRDRTLESVLSRLCAFIAQIAARLKSSKIRWRCERRNTGHIFNFRFIICPFVNNWLMFTLHTFITRSTRLQLLRLPSHFLCSRYKSAKRRKYVCILW